jgi:hypothetical protein
VQGEIREVPVASRRRSPPALDGRGAIRSGQLPAWRRRETWRKILAVIFTPLAGIGAGTGTGALNSGPVSPRASTVVPEQGSSSSGTLEAAIVASISHRLGSGGEYWLTRSWQEFAVSHGRAAAERLAADVVDRVSLAAGRQVLTADARRYCIQLVLGGIGGLNPSEAADVLELSVDVANDVRLTSLTEKMAEDYVPSPLTTVRPPYDDVLAGLYWQEWNERFGAIYADPGGPKPDSTDPAGSPAHDDGNETGAEHSQE